MEQYHLSYPINTVSWDGKVVTRLSDESFLPTCRILKNVGVNELMITGYVTVEKADFDMMEETKRLGGLLDSMGMRPAQHHGLSATYAPLDKSQELVIENLIRSVRLTANLNSPVLVIHPSHFCDQEVWGSVSLKEMLTQQIEHHGIDRIIETISNNIHEAGKEAQRLGVKIALENEVDEIMLSYVECLPQIIKKADSPAVGFCLDAGHAHCHAKTTPSAWMDLMGDKVFTTHFHDNRGKRDEHLPVGFGTIPWIDVIQSLWKNGYSNTVNFEAGGWQGVDAKEGYESAIRYWRVCEVLAQK